MASTDTVSTSALTAPQTRIRTRRAQLRAKAARRIQHRLRPPTPSLTANASPGTSPTTTASTATPMDTHALLAPRWSSKRPPAPAPVHLARAPRTPTPHPPCASATTVRVVRSVVRNCISHSLHSLLTWSSLVFFRPGCCLILLCHDMYEGRVQVILVPTATALGARIARQELTRT